ncbi:MAG: hypothetical protein AB8G23_10165 [Myxococcota bacterium]
MVNLLSRASALDPFPALDEADWATLLARAARCAAVFGSNGYAVLEGQAEVYAAEWDELDQAPSLASAAFLVEAIDVLRLEWLAANGGDGEGEAARAEEAAAGRLYLYRPGRALGTGEAEIASQGYLDSADCPPRWSWLFALGRRGARGLDDFEVGVLFWVPPGDDARMAAGVQASPTQSVLRLDEASPAIERQWSAERSAGR